MPIEKRKQSLYFPEDMLSEIQAESTRQDRSMSWVVQQAWRLARSEVMRFPGMININPSSPEPPGGDG